ncbi:pyruvate, phosphate dikinase [Gluconacetobacter entanii]|uniref:pyruvate, phosphate dikinase n=1 Tax=Gluconacetobacter entanii TaxID=108528 RepID=UPI001C936AB9|nr:pyruvate, phosphate dikinase [Gluconacetobacter entanii]MBY4641149.1 pyruvate, phosphate dikinase [Gluconacetobacter entanii]MCW4580214.1 pyruvate, phosphate dikinase [Gluconacetobacter entanii]MCW4583544.1 pyruvate, phosphate dikinase [Gluconacetobacter entanii]MCW4586890.1 pyruvate, phosphate dikinase [Gluconacetobacter entanii]
MTKWVYSFGNGLNEGRAEMRNLLGGKGANLAEMASIGLPVPPGFTITTEVCSAFYDNGRKYPEDLRAQVDAAMQRIEGAMGLRFGDADAPLLVSVRSGARVSMPGMMDTVLNLGLNDETVQGLARSSGDERFAWDSYRRFVQMYGSVVMGVAHHHFEDVLDQFKRTLGVIDDTAITAAQWREVVKAYHEIIHEHTGQEFPSDPQAQLWGAIGAVFGSWMNPRANTYRRLHDIPASWGTAVNVQSMVFGNMGDDCATGVCFTRDPSTGEDVFYGEYLVNAQGEDVVAGIRTPQPMSRARAEEGQHPMETVLPDAYAELLRVRTLLERHYRDMQDIEFTVQRNVLYLLQTRNGKRTAAAALKIAIDMAREGLISKEDAICRVPATSLDQLLHPALDPKADRVQLTRGLPASPGAASGAVVFTAEECEARAARGEDVILVRVETSPEDVHGMHAARGVLTARGGMTSHAAVVARGMGRVCVAGAGSVHIDYATMVMTIDGHSIAEGDWITLDGSTGAVYLGRVATIPPILSDDFNTLMGWADSIRRLGVRANAETPDDAKTACRFGAEGIGLARTEHMFFGPDRIGHVRQMIIADEETVRQRAINALLVFQRDDFVSIFRIMAGLPVTVRLLDPPLHEFLPHAEAEFAEVATALGKTVEEIRARCASLAEANPMLGHRGCRLGLTNPEIYAMQVRAIIEAALQVSDETGKGIVPEIMIPLVATKAELEVARRAAEAEISAVLQERGAALDYRIGTMIELPRAAIQAGEIAHHADFFSLGTNDLTQTTFGLSRDDAGSFLPFYVDHGLLPKDPFVSIDREGVGALVRMGVERGRAAHPGLKLGICGEHGGDPDSIAFFDEVGLDYVSCSPFRVPVARLAAAQAALAHRKENASA